MKKGITCIQSSVCCCGCPLLLCCGCMSERVAAAWGKEGQHHLVAGEMPVTVVVPVVAGVRVCKKGN